MFQKLIPYLLCLASFLFAQSGVKVFDYPVTDAEIPVLQEIASKLGSHSIVRADFRQVKEVEALEMPLISTGTLLFARDKGISWTQKTPFSEQYTLFPDGSISNGTEVERSPFPGSAAMLDIFAGDLNRLEAVFDLYFVKKGNSWSLGLIPIKRMIQRAMASMILEGDSSGRVNRFILKGSQGSSTTITFTHDTTTQELSPEEVKLFSHE